MFDKNEYFDINITYAKENVSDIFIKIAVSKRGAAPAPVTVLPTVWFYNRWVDTPDEPRTAISLLNKTVVTANHSRLGNYYFYFQPADERLFTENETNFSKIDAGVAKTPFTKDAFYEAIVNGVNMAKLRSKKVGTKFSPVYELVLQPAETQTIYCRLTSNESADPFTVGFENIFTARHQEADDFYNAILPSDISADLRNI